MNHQEALRDMAVERYLLGELNGVSLDSFEEHLFDCSDCALNVRTGLVFIDTAKAELGGARKLAASEGGTGRRWTSWFTNPWVLAPALAACLLVLAFQTFIVQPRLKLEIAQAQAPAVLNPLVLANPGARGDSIPQILVPEHGTFVISLDVPAPGGFSSYLCSLHAPDGSLVWQTTVSPEQAHDAVLINLPTIKTKEGLNTFLIQGLPANGNANGRLINLAKYRFLVTFKK